MATFRILPNYTYADYCNWEGRWEVIDGIPFAMSPSPSIRHQWIKINLLSEYVGSIKKSGDKNLKVFPSIDFITDAGAFFSQLLVPFEFAGFNTT